MARNDELYQILLEHRDEQAQRDNKLSEQLGFLIAKTVSIEEQTKKTNGRVTTLEQEQQKDKVRWAKVSGGVTVLVVLWEVFKDRILGFFQ